MAGGQLSIEKRFKELRLHGMCRGWRLLQEIHRHRGLDLSEGLELLLQAEREYRDSIRVERLLKQAGFRYRASIEDLYPDTSRGIDSSLITELATGNYLSNGDAILITGPSGAGKSFLASALGHQACVQGYKVAYYNLQKLLVQTRMSRAGGSIYTFMEKLSHADLLILDDFGLTHLEQQQSMDLMEIMEDRHSRKATILISQLPVSGWYDVIGEKTVADAILDRLVHTTYRIELKGESLRRKK